MKKKLSLILAAFLLFAAFAGCGRKTDRIDADTDELTIHLHYFGYCVFNDDWQIFKKAAELTGINADWDTYIETVNGMGYSEWERIYNDAYKRQKDILK